MRRPVGGVGPSSAGRVGSQLSGTGSSSVTRKAPTGATGLEEYLSSNLYTRVETLDLATLFDLERVPDLADPARQQRFFVAIGAALRMEEGAA